MKVYVATYDVKQLYPLWTVFTPPSLSLHPTQSWNILFVLCFYYAITCLFDFFTKTIYNKKKQLTSAIKLSINCTNI